MADTVSPLVRSAIMRSVRQRNTKPELIVRSTLHSMGYRFTVNGPSNRRLPGRPDIVLPRHRIVIFVHGCFWHRHPNCRLATTPATRRDFWNAKFQANVTRDARNRSDLVADGWQVVTVWECETRNKPDLASTLGRLICRHSDRSS